MTTMLDRREAATGRRDKARSGTSLMEQKRILEQATKKTVGLASRAFTRTLEQQLERAKREERDQ